MIKINENEMEDIGIVSHYKNKPFSGLAFVIDNNGEEKTLTEFKNGLKHGKQINKSFTDWRFESMLDKFNYTLYYEEDKCINYGENYIKMAVNLAYREFCFDEFDGMKERCRRINPKENWKKSIVNDIRWDAESKIIDNALHEIFQKLEERKANSVKEVNWFKEQNKLMKKMGLDNTDKNRKIAFEKMIAVNKEFENPNIHFENAKRERAKKDKIEEKRKNSKNIKTETINLFKTKLDNFYVQYYYVLGEGIDLDDGGQWGNNKGEWGSEYEKYAGDEVEDKISDFIYNFFNPGEILATDGYCLLELENNTLTFSIEEDTENNQEFNFETLQHEEKILAEDYKPVFIKWEITDDGIIEIKQ